MKIVNNSVLLALKNLGYTEIESEDIIQYMIGAGTLIGAPDINPETLMAKGLTKEEIAKVETLASKAFDIESLFSIHNLGASLFNRLIFLRKNILLKGFHY